jgi:hypothetical protein
VTGILRGIRDVAYSADLPGSSQHAASILAGLLLRDHKIRPRGHAHGDLDGDHFQVAALHPSPEGDRPCGDPFEHEAVAHVSVTVVGISVPQLPEVARDVTAVASYQAMEKQRRNRLVILLAGIALLGGNLVDDPEPSKPEMMFSDMSRLGRPFAKDPAVVKFDDSYWIYFSLPPHADHSKGTGWSAGIARSDDLVHWEKVGRKTVLLSTVRSTSYQRITICPGLVRNGPCPG